MAKTTSSKNRTPSQVRAQIVSVLRSNFDYRVTSLCREFGRNKAWLRPRCAVRAPMKRARDIAYRMERAGLPRATVRKGYGGEWLIDGPGFRLIVNQYDCGGGRTSDVFVETVKATAPDHWRMFDGNPEEI